MNVILAHPSPTVAEGLILVLRRHGQFESVRAVTDLQALLDGVTAGSPSIAALHADLPGLNYETHIPQVRASAPQCAVAVFAATRNGEDARRAMQAGARAYLSLDAPPQELVRQLFMAASGDVVISALAADGASDVMTAPAGGAVPASSSRTENDLSDRELEVLRLVAEGRTNLEIADALTLTGNTVKAHVRSILRKLQLRNRQQATAFAVQKGLLARIESPADEPSAVQSGGPMRVNGPRVPIIPSG